MRMTNEEVIEYFKKNAIRIKGIMAEEDEALKDRFSQTLEATEMAIKALQQEPKTGHWEWVQYDYNPKLGNWHCSECSSIVIECVNKKDKGGIPLYKYCPQCGARMVGE